MRGSMLTSEDKAKQDSERKALKTYWKGSQDKPFVLDRHDAYYVCEVIFPSIFAPLRCPLHAVVVGMICLIPVSTLKVLFLRLMGVTIDQLVDFPSTVCIS